MNPIRHQRLIRVQRDQMNCVPTFWHLADSGAFQDAHPIKCVFSLMKMYDPYSTLQEVADEVRQGELKWKTQISRDAELRVVGKENTVALFMWTGNSIYPCVTYHMRAADRSEETLLPIAPFVKRLNTALHSLPQSCHYQGVSISYIFWLNKSTQNHHSIKIQLLTSTRS